MRAYERERVINRMSVKAIRGITLALSTRRGGPACAGHGAFAACRCGMAVKRAGAYLTALHHMRKQRLQNTRHKRSKNMDSANAHRMPPCRPQHKDKSLALSFFLSFSHSRHVHVYQKPHTYVHVRIYMLLSFECMHDARQRCENQSARHYAKAPSANIETHVCRIHKI